MNSRKWLIGWSVLTVIAVSVIGMVVFWVDPFFHYRKPDTGRYFYQLNNERSQNPGIVTRFDYDALITGTSMTENFKASEADELFGVSSVKTCFSGGTYKEIDDNVRRALANNPNVKLVIRGLDLLSLCDDKDYIRTDMGVHPSYLYDNNPFNDVKYLFNKDTFWGRSLFMIIQSKEDDFSPGITSFDEYGRWHYNFTYGVNSIFPNGVGINDSADPVHLSEEEKETLRGNIEQNVIMTAEEYPEVEFYYFFPPYSIGWWNDLKNSGTIYSQLEAEQYAMELILGHDNIHLYGFADRTDITTDLNNYEDAYHYGQWINSLILRSMKDGRGLITEDNYLDYISSEYDFYSSYDYSYITEQEDYKSDFYAAALLNKEITGAEVKVISDSGQNDVLEGKYVVSPDDGYRYLKFDVYFPTEDAASDVVIIDEKGIIVDDVHVMSEENETEWNNYVIELKPEYGESIISFNGNCSFKNITLF